MTPATQSPSAPVCVDLFAGAGGLSEGLMSAGLDVVASVELHPQAALSHAFNHPSTKVFVGDVREWNTRLLEAELRDRGASQLDVVVGGPPCQGFSSAGKKHPADPRNSLFKAYADVVAQYHPRMFLLENVPGFRSMFGGSTYREAIATFRGLGYEIFDDIVRAADYGVPQTRQRFVMVGWLPGEAKPFELEPVEARSVAAGEALRDIDFLEPGFEATRHLPEAELSSYAASRRSGTLLFNHLATRHRDRAIRIMSEIAEGRTIRDVDPALRSAKRTMSRLDRTRLAGTVLSLPDDMIHYGHDRILTVRENARLQTFDDDFVFFGKRTSGFVERRVDVPQYTQVGNAVPPLLAKALGRALARSLGHTEPLPDHRELARRRSRHEHVRGSSGWAGYTLGPEIVGELGLWTVRGAPIDLPTSEEDISVFQQPALREWAKSSGPRRGQWAPGVKTKASPAWKSCGC